jgi:hypothetical protein
LFCRGEARKADFPGTLGAVIRRNRRAPWRVDDSAVAFPACIKGISMLVSVLVTFLVVILILYLINLLPLDGRAKQIVRVVVIILGVISLLKYIAVF